MYSIICVIGYFSAFLALGVSGGNPDELVIPVSAAVRLVVGASKHTKWVDVKLIVKNLPRNVNSTIFITEQRNYNQYSGALLYDSVLIEMASLMDGDKCTKNIIFEEPHGSASPTSIAYTRYLYKNICKTGTPSPGACEATWDYYSSKFVTICRNQTPYTDCTLTVDFKNECSKA